MIPKQIHYCWFGNHPLSPLALGILDGWRKLLPHIEIIRWDENNAPMQDDFMRIAYSEERWAFCADWTRLHVLNHCGGLCLDSDLELIKDIGPLWDLDAFCGWESTNSMGSAVLASRAEFPLWNQVRRRMLELLFGSGQYESLAKLIHELVGSEMQDRAPTKITLGDSGLVHLPTDYFYPYHHSQKFHPECVSPRTIGIHHWVQSWI